MTWNQIWAAWLGLVGVSFGIFEGLGLAARGHGKGQPPNESLSEVTWWFLKVVPGQGIEHWTLPHVLAGVVVLGLVLILGGHLILGLWR